MRGSVLHVLHYEVQKIKNRGDNLWIFFIFLNLMDSWHLSAYLPPGEVIPSHLCFLRVFTCSQRVCVSVYE